LRAGFAIGLLGALLALSTPVHADQSWQFRVLLDDSEIGTHDYRIAERDDERRVEIDARFIVTFLAVEVYRYVHTATERWHGNCLDNIDSRTDDNGDLIAVHGKSSGGRFEVRTSTAATTTPGCMMSFAYWNPVFLSQRHLLNSQTGEVMDVHVDAMGDETLTVRGVPTATRHYALHGSNLRLDLWYTQDGRWVQLESRTSRGSLLKYVLR
jgi:hypothetical protein